MVLKNLRTTVVMLIMLTLATGIIYPTVVTGLAQLLFPDAANGSIIERNGTIAGSGLIGQPFSEPKYFWGRPSATQPFACNAGASSGSNYGPLSPALHDAVRRRISDLKRADPQNAQPIPVDLVTASGSGLDPHISMAAALYQVNRVARVRKMSTGQVRSLLEQCTEGRQLGFLGETCVNVLKLNLALDENTSSPEVR